jgi:hypothetical protein
MKTSIAKKIITPACTILALALFGTTSAQAGYGYGYGGYNGCGCVKRVSYVKVKKVYTCYKPVVRYYRPVVRYVRYVPTCNPCYTYSSCSSCGSGLFGWF